MYYYVVDGTSFKVSQILSGYITMTNNAICSHSKNKAISNKYDLKTYSQSNPSASNVIISGINYLI